MTDQKAAAVCAALLAAAAAGPGAQSDQHRAFAGDSISSKDLIDRALSGRDFGAWLRILGLFGGISLASFALNAVSGLRYTRVSAEILFDMRLSLSTGTCSGCRRGFTRTRGSATS